MSPGLRPLGLLTLLAMTWMAVSCSTTPKGPVAVVETKNRAAEYTSYGNEAFQEGDYERALTFFQQALAMNLSVDNGPGVVRSLGSLGKVRLANRDFAGARELFERAARLAAEETDPALGIQTAVNLAELHLRQDEPREAEQLLEALSADDPALGESADLAIYYHTLAVAEQKQDKVDEAVAHLELALAVNRKIKSPRETASNLIVLASIHTAQGDYQRARAEAAEALELDKQVEYSLGIAQDLTALGLIAQRMASHEESFRYFERAYGVYEALGHEAGRAGVLAWLVASARSAGLTAEAEAYERLAAQTGTPEAASP